MSDDSVTILKYRHEDRYNFVVMDKFDEPDEPTRLDKMMELSGEFAMAYGSDYEQIWIKTCPIFPTK